MKKENEMLDEMCLSCGGTVEVTTFYDGDEFDCLDCGARHVWSVCGEDDANLALLDDDWRVPRKEIEELKKECSAMRRRIDRMLNDYHNSLEVFADDTLKLTRERDALKCCGNCENYHSYYEEHECYRQGCRTTIHDNSGKVRYDRESCRHWGKRK